MTEVELGKKLHNLYLNAAENGKVTMIHLFGIKYGKIIIENNYSFTEIAKQAGISETYGTEISKGVNLSKYVTII